MSRNNNRSGNNYDGPEKVGALWKPRNSNSKLVASGVLQLEGRDGETIRIFVLPNPGKDTNDKAPDFNIFLSTEDDESRKGKSGRNGGNKSRGF